MLRIAVPNKGSLSDAAGDMLREAGSARDPLLGTAMRSMGMSLSQRWV